MKGQGYFHFAKGTSIWEIFWRAPSPRLVQQRPWYLWPACNLRPVVTARPTYLAILHASNPFTFRLLHIAFSNIHHTTLIKHPNKRQVDPKGHRRLELHLLPNEDRDCRQGDRWCLLDWDARWAITLDRPQDDLEVGWKRLNHRDAGGSMESGYGVADIHIYSDIQKYHTCKQQ